MYIPAWQLVDIISEAIRGKEYPIYAPDECFPISEWLAVQVGILEAVDRHVEGAKIVRSRLPKLPKSLRRA